MHHIEVGLIFRLEGLEDFQLSMALPGLGSFNKLDAGRTGLWLSIIEQSFLFPLTPCHVLVNCLLQSLGLYRSPKASPLLSLSLPVSIVLLTCRTRANMVTAAKSLLQGCQALWVALQIYRGGVYGATINPFWAASYLDYGL
jgi:hypothetical protein